MHIKAQFFNIWFSYISIFVLCTMGVTFFLVAAFDLIPFEPPEDRIPFLVFVLFWNAFLFWLSYVFFKMPIEIVVTHTSSISLRSPIRTTILDPSQITKVSCDSDGDWSLYHTKGRLDLRYFKYDKLKNFLRWVILKNPYIQAPDELK